VGKVKPDRFADGLDPTPESIGARFDNIRSKGMGLSSICTGVFTTVAVWPTAVVCCSLLAISRVPMKEARIVPAIKADFSQRVPEDRFVNRR